jgi:archaellum component FlaC
MTPLTEPIQKEELKEVFTEALEPFIDSIKEDFNKVDERFDKVDKRFENMDEHLDRIEGRLDKIETTMVTKSYLDDKLADLEGGLISKLRKEDEKVNRLIEVLKYKSVLNSEDIKQFNEFQIFPKV